MAESLVSLKALASVIAGAAVACVVAIPALQLKAAGNCCRAAQKLATAAPGNKHGWAAVRVERAPEGFAELAARAAAAQLHEQAARHRRGQYARAPGGSRPDWPFTPCGADAK